MSAAREAAARYARLRQAGAPRLLTPSQAWHLSGGVMGARDEGDRVATVTLAAVAQRVPDCEAFLPDLLEVLKASAS